MSRLTLVRHGQATPFATVTDRLSATGEAQAKRLAQFWMRHDIQFDAAYSGTLQRQQRTAEIVSDSFAQASLHFPAVETTSAFNEYDAEGILRKLAPAFAEENREFKRLSDDYLANRETPERNRYFQRMF